MDNATPIDAPAAALLSALEQKALRAATLEAVRDRVEVGLGGERWNDVKIASQNKTLAEQLRTLGLLGRGRGGSMFKAVREAVAGKTSPPAMPRRRSTSIGSVSPTARRKLRGGSLVGNDLAEAATEAGKLAAEEAGKAAHDGGALSAQSDDDEGKADTWDSLDDDNERMFVLWKRIERDVASIGIEKKRAGKPADAAGLSKEDLDALAEVRKLGLEKRVYKKHTEARLQEAIPKPYSASRDDESDSDGFYSWSDDGSDGDA